MSEPQGPGSPPFLESLGDRGRRRAEPRTSISLAGAGCALAVLGVVLLAGDTGVDDDTGEFSRLPGLVLSALMVGLGYFLLSAVRRGPLATAGTVAGALGVPAFMFFLTFDESGYPPYEMEAILVVSTCVWLASYAVGPGRGRPFFLGAGLIALWLTVLELTENVFETPYLFPFGYFFFPTSSSSFESTGVEIDSESGEVLETGGDIDSGFEGPSFDLPDPATIGGLSLGLGLAFVLIGRWLDTQGRHGAATPFAFAAIPCLAVGVIGLSPDLDAAGSGVLLVVIGIALAHNGGSTWRRGTSWIGGATTALGLAIFLGDMADDSVTTGGMLYVAGGIAMVFLGHLIATGTSEPDELAVTTPLTPAATPSRRVLTADPDDDDSQWRPPAPPDEA